MGRFHDLDAVLSGKKLALVFGVVRWPSLMINENVDIHLSSRLTAGANSMPFLPEWLP